MDLKNIPKPCYVPFDFSNNFCGCGIEKNDTIRRDCHFYHEERWMEGRIDCCTRQEGIGVCPCTPDCADYISQDEINNAIETYIRQRNQKNTEE